MIDYYHHHCRHYHHQYVCCFVFRPQMANELLKEVFQEVYAKIVGINPDSVIDTLFSKKIICCDDWQRLHNIPVTTDRCRKLLLLLFELPHPQTFIYLRLALIDEYSWIVAEIDKELPLLSCQLQQLQLDSSTDGKHMFFVHILCSYLAVMLG